VVVVEKWRKKSWKNSGKMMEHEGRWWFTGGLTIFTLQ
jgi:hypothetical protein